VSAGSFGRSWRPGIRSSAWSGVDTLLLRRTYPELESSLLAYFRRDVPRDLYKKYNGIKARSFCSLDSMS
jgi:hypothetical protein